MIKKIFLISIVVMVLVFCAVYFYRAQTEMKIDTSLIDPLVTRIVTSSDGSDYKDASHSFYRLIERNTEYNPCLVLEEITHYKQTGPRILATQKLCSVSIDDTMIDLREVQALEYSNFSWNADGLFFDMNVSRARSPDRLMRCEVEYFGVPHVMCTN